MKTLAYVSGHSCLTDGVVAYVTQQAIDIDPKIPLIASASRLRLCDGGIMVLSLEYMSHVGISESRVAVSRGA